MKRYHMIIDVEKCENCNNCFLSCKDEHCGNDWDGVAASQPTHGHRWMNIKRKERGRFPVIDVAYLPTPCMQCDNPPCRDSSDNDAVVQREDGIVIIDPVKAVGQKKIVSACPYGAIWWNDEKQLPQKCTFCAHLIDSGWKQPRCVQACPTGALSFHYVEDAEMQTMVKEQDLTVIHEAHAFTRPKVYYKNLYRYEKCFLAGSVASGDAKYSECTQGAQVALYINGKVVADTLTDDFGEFKFDALVPSDQIYKVEITKQGQPVKELQVTLKESLSLGTIWLE